jgi:hypothetical protein
MSVAHRDITWIFPEKAIERRKEAVAIVLARICCRLFDFDTK